jgi:hypothetical protein
MGVLKWSLRESGPELLSDFMFIGFLGCGLFLEQQGAPFEACSVIIPAIIGFILTASVV